MLKLNEEMFNKLKADKQRRGSASWEAYVMELFGFATERREEE